jgi:hypothetical protein
MKNLALVVALLISTIAFSQKNKVGFTLIPSSTNTVSSFSNQLTPTKPKWALNASINFERTIGERLSVISGINYINNGYQTEKTEARFSNIPNPSPQFQSFSRKMNFRYLGIPIGVNYYVSNKKVKFFIQAGVNVAYLLQVQSKFFMHMADGSTEVNRSNLTSDSEYNRFNLSVFTNFGTEIGLGNNFLLRIAPEYRYALTDAVADGVAYDSFFTSIGLRLSLLKGL